MTLASQVADALVEVGTDFKEIDAIIGSLASLTTTDKASVVAAINEIQSEVGSGASINDLATETTSVWSSSKTDTEIGAAVAALVDASPATLDTLNELAAALGDDPNFATTIAADIGAKQDGDAGLTSIAGLTTAADKMIYTTALDTYATADLTAVARTFLAAIDVAAQRTALDVYSKAEIGDPATDFAGIYNTARA